MPPQDPQSQQPVYDPTSDDAFLKASPERQRAYLTATDPDYAKASPARQTEYLRHVTGVAPAAPEKPSAFQRADTAITSALSPNPANYSSLARTQLEVPKTIGREVYEGAKTVGSMLNPVTYYHAFADKPEGGEIGLAGDPAKLAAYRMFGQPTMTAMGDYVSGRVTPEAALSVAPEAMGQGTGAVVGGKLMEVAAPQTPRNIMERPALTAFRMTPGLNKLPEVWRSTAPEALAHEAEMRSPLRLATDRAIAEGRANPIKTTISPEVAPAAPIDPMYAATKQAIAEGRAMRIPPGKLGSVTPPEPAPAALGRGTVSGSPDAALGRIPAMQDPYANVESIRGRLTAVPRESWEMGEVAPTELPQSEVLGRMGTTAGEKAALRNFMTSNPSALERIAPTGPAAAPGAAGSMAEDVIHGNLAKGRGRMILTPEEALQREQLYRIAQRQAHERGMQFAGGQVPAEGRTVPIRPRPNPIEEWTGKKLPPEE